MAVPSQIEPALQERIMVNAIRATRVAERVWLDMENEASDVKSLTIQHRIIGAIKSGRKILDAATSDDNPDTQGHLMALAGICLYVLAEMDLED